MKYEPGTVVYLTDSQETFPKPNLKGIVHHGFMGADGEEKYVIEIKNGKTVTYALRTFNVIWDTKRGKSNFDKRRSDPAFCMRLLHQAGIITKTGKLSKKYKS